MTKKAIIWLVVIIVVAVIIIVSAIYFMTKPSDTTTRTNSNSNTGNTAPKAVSYTDVSPQEAKNLIDSTPNLTIIDVSPDYNDGHLPGAVNYYLGDGSLARAIPQLDKKAPYLVYCRIDSAARTGAQTLIDAGFTNVYRLAGNYDTWVAAGYAVEK